MNLATILMCWNVPRMSEDLVYELFCNAGPIEEVSFAGKSCFVIYEHADAVITAKEIFKDVKLNGRPLRMFDNDEIAKIYSQQEETTQSRNYECENNSSPNFQNRCYDGPGVVRNAPDYRGCDRYSEPNRGGSLPYYSPNFNPSHRPRMENDQNREWRADFARNSSVTSYSNQSCQGRPDLLPPSTSQFCETRQRDGATNEFQNLMNAYNEVFENLTNPYSVPVSRNSPNMRDNFSARSSQQDGYKYDAGSSEPRAREKWKDGNAGGSRYSNHSNSEYDELHGRNMAEQFDQSREFNNPINKGDTRYENRRNDYDNSHSGHYRNHPYRKHQSDRKPYSREQMHTNSSPSGSIHRSRDFHHSHHREQDRNYRQHKHKSRKH